MAKKSWNDFIKNHPSRTIFGASVSANLPSAAQFDKKNRKLPSPYGLFNEWAKNNLKGEWSATKVPGGFYIAVSQQQDVDLIKSTFGFLGEPISTPVSRKTQKIGYSDSRYASIARALGYSF